MDQIFQYTPAGISTKAVIHASQLTLSVNYQQYNYELFGNLAKYGRFTPPVYDLRRVNIPVAIWYGDSDWLSSTVDVDRLASVLPDVIEKYLIPVHWNHLDFIWAKNARSILYDRMVNVMQRNESN